MSETVTPYLPGQAAVMPQYVVNSNGSGEQAIGTDFTIYAGQGGIDVDKVLNSGMHFTFIQIGIGMQTSVLLDEQIQAAQAGGLDFGFFHLPSAYAGPVKEQAQHAYDVVKQRGFEDHLIMGDLEPAVSGDYGSLISADQGWIYHQHLEFLSGRRQVEYSNPNVLKYKWLEPSWIYNVDWIMARYPKIYYYFDDFLGDYSWSPVYGYLPDDFYNQCVLGVQFTKKLRAKEYFSVDRLPDGGDGLNSGDGYALLMTPADAKAWFVSESIPDPDPDPEIIERLDELDKRLTEVEAVVYTLANDIEDLQARVTALENTDPEPKPEPEPEDFIMVEISDQHPPYYYFATDKSCPDATKGKPDMLRKDGLEPFKVGSLWKVQAKLALSCHDNPATPRIIGADGRHYFRIVQDGDYKGRFIIAEKATKVT